MHKRIFGCSAFFLGACLLLSAAARGQENGAARIHVNVNLVQLNVAVTDHKGHYVTGLQPHDFLVMEDGISEQVATFAEGNQSEQTLPGVMPPGGALPKPGEASENDSLRRVSASQMSSLVSGASVFVLFDTSNYMYRGFVFAQDAITDFVRSLEAADRVAFYSYSRDLSREALLTSDRSQVLRGVRTTVAGDDAALYNCLLLTIKDAAQFTGRKIIVVFSNGPDNASMVPPEEVAELAQSTGTTIYMVSTEQAHFEPISSAVFERMTAATGGKVYFAKNWQEEQDAFASIRDDLAHLYSLSYYPRPNPNDGWRTISVKLVDGGPKGYRIRTRNGYRFQRSPVSSDVPSLVPAGSDSK